MWRWDEMTIFLTLQCNHHKNLDKSHQHNKSRIFTRERGKLSSRNCWLSFEIQERLKVAWWKVLTFCFSSGVATLVLGLSGLVLSYTCCHLIQFDLLWQTIFVKIPVEITDPLDVDCDHSSGYWELSVVSSCRRHHVTWTLSILRILQEMKCEHNSERPLIYIDYSNIILLDTKLKTPNLLIFCQCIMLLSHSTFT